jgi:DNA replication protein DnaC
MRDQKTWEEVIHPKVLVEFTPRLQKDIIEIPYKLEDIPEFGSYYIYGKASSGKTLLAAHMYIQARKRQFLEAIKGKFIFVNTYDFFNELKNTFKKDDFPEDVVMDKYRSAAYLVLDDIGSTKFTDWQISVLQQLINYRYEYLLPTVFTSNLHLGDLGEAMGDDRIPSRIERMCNEILEK